MDDIDEWLRQAHADQARMEAQNAAFKAEQRRMQMAMDLFQTRWALYCAELHILMLRGMFDPNFCKPTARDADGQHG